MNEMFCSALITEEDEMYYLFLVVYGWINIEKCFYDISNVVFGERNFMHFSMQVIPFCWLKTQHDLQYILDGLYDVIEIWT